MVGEVVFTVPRWASAGARGRLGLTTTVTLLPASLAPAPLLGLGWEVSPGGGRLKPLQFLVVCFI